ncbi:MAG: hypothetical protein K8H87_11545 [Pseudorhodoplanes sp.]|nr:hypothetical protein [Pseudorhodoplanes sp.]
MDLPVWDDWRAYVTGKDGTFGTDYLLKPSNDTIYAVGKVFDSLVQRLLNGNSIAYQLLSMITVLGGLLAIQWILLKRVLRDRMLYVTCFTSTIFMLQTGSYWGKQNIAYHQALPLIFLLLCLLIIIKYDWKNIHKASAVSVLGAAAGLSYTSGAFASIAMAIAVLIFCIAYRSFRRRALVSAIALLVVGLLTAWAQLRSVRFNDSLTSPLDMSFWFYVLGKIGRALLLPTTTLFLPITLIFVGGCAFIATRILLNAVHARRDNLKIDDLDVVVLSVAAVVFVYLLMVAAGRAGHRSDTINAIGHIYLRGFSRFHFFWVTILFPWVLAYLMTRLKKHLRKPTLYKVCFGVGLFVTIFGIARGGFNYGAYFHQNVDRFRVAASTCMLETLAQGRSAKCEAIPEVIDWPRGYAYAVSIGASFTRSLPPQLLLSRTDEAAPWTDVIRDKTVQKEFRDATVSVQADGVVRVAAEANPQIVFSVGTAEHWGQCVVMEIESDLDTSNNETVQLSFKTVSKTKFVTTRRVKNDSNDDAINRVRMMAYSYSGFANRFQFDLVSVAKTILIKELRVRCLLSALVERSRGAARVTDSQPAADGGAMVAD